MLKGCTEVDLLQCTSRVKWSHTYLENFTKKCFFGYLLSLLYLTSQFLPIFLPQMITNVTFDEFKYYIKKREGGHIGLLNLNLCTKLSANDCPNSCFQLNQGIVG